MIKKIMLSCSALAMVASASSVQAQQFTVSVQNLTHGINFTPLLISAHDATTHLFQVGSTASTELQAMAEGGNIDGLVSLLGNANNVVNPAGGLLAPGATSPAMSVDTGTGGNDYLSVVAMLLPTNDGFLGLDGWKIPATPGTYTININAYDAGTEANDEIINGGGASNTPGIPAAPTGPAGVGATGVAGVDSNTSVHIHRGNLGDTDATGGSSDVDSRVHRWLNPVARVTVTVQ